MQEFELEVHYRGERIAVPGYLSTAGYLHKIYLDVNGTQLILEPDEERNYRAVVAPEEVDKIPKELVSLIVDEVTQALR